jgi:hypothetical protein
MVSYCIYLGYRRIESRGRGRIGQGYGSVHAHALARLNSLSK